MTSNTNLIDVRQAPQYSQYMQSLGWQIGQFKNVRYFIKKIPLTPFCIIKILKASKLLNNQEVKNLKQKHKALIFKQEPLIIESQQGGQIYFQVEKNNTWPVTPTKTIWLDLTKSKEIMLNSMAKRTRWTLKKAQAQNLITKIIYGDKISDEQLQDFYQLWSKNKPHNWLFKPSFNNLKSSISAFGSKCFFVFCFSPRHPELVSGSPSNNLQAVCLILTSPNASFYWHATSTQTGNQLGAPTLCFWQAIKENKKLGKKVLDLEGVWDERFPKLNKGWRGLTLFKQGFCN